MLVKSRCAVGCGRCHVYAISYYTLLISRSSVQVHKKVSFQTQCVYRTNQDVGRPACSALCTGRRALNFLQRGLQPSHTREWKPYQNRTLLYMLSMFLSLLILTLASRQDVANTSQLYQCIIIQQQHMITPNDASTIKFQNVVILGGTYNIKHYSVLKDKT